MRTMGTTRRLQAAKPTAPIGSTVRTVTTTATVIRAAAPARLFSRGAIPVLPHPPPMIPEPTLLLPEAVVVRHRQAAVPDHPFPGPDVVNKNDRTSMNDVTRTPA